MRQFLEFFELLSFIVAGFVSGFIVTHADDEPEPAPCVDAAVKLEDGQTVMCHPDADLRVIHARWEPVVFCDCPNEGEEDEPDAQTP